MGKISIRLLGRAKRETAMQISGFIRFHNGKLSMGGKIIKTRVPVIKKRERKKEKPLIKQEELPL
jgi:hypothetical protein